MKMRIRISLLIFSCLTILVSALQAQKVNLDNPVRAGALTLFPDVSDANTYFYISDKPRLATGQTGLPQFSFLRYVENVRTGPNQAEQREGEGGGIVHAVVELAVTPDQLDEARRELRRINPNGKIQGPVIFRSGKFGLISSFTDTNGNLSTQVIGIGNAPILDGGKAAVSMQLTKLGSKILWQSFQTPTPDISFSFEMELEGYRSPKKAIIEADFDQIYEHESFAVGVASQYLAGEIKGAFDDLMRKGAIKLTQVGEDEKMEALITTAYNKITEMMFSPMGGASSTASIGGLAASAQQQTSALDRATQMLAKNRQEAQQENTRIRADNERREREERERTARTQGGTTPPASGTGATPGTTPPASGTASSTPGGGSSGTTRPEGSAEAEGPDRPVPSSQQPRNFGPIAADNARPTDEPTRSEPREEVTVPSIAIVASFEMKRVRQQGIFRINLNKSTADTLTLRFDENIGDLRAHLENDDVFRAVNLEDPLYLQREIVVFVDGINANDFGDYINFASVQLRKTHEGGDITNDEVRVDRNNFSSEGNAFKMLYGWKRDTDRRKWLDYQFKINWSFFGGTSVETEWMPATAAALALAPPYQRRRIDLEADPGVVEDEGIRSITVKLFSKMGKNERVVQSTLRPSRDSGMSDSVDIILPANVYEYEYEVEWRLRGNRTIKSGRQKSDSSILFVDELPQT